MLLLAFASNTIFLLEGVATTEEKLENMNARVPIKTLLEVRKSAKALGIKMQRFVLFSIKLGLFFLQHLGWKETGEVAEETYGMLCLKAGRNYFAEKRGFNVNTLDAGIAELEALLNENEG